MKTPELTTDQWKNVIDRLSDIGVFILAFTGGEPTLARICQNMFCTLKAKRYCDRLN